MTQCGYTCEILSLAFLFEIVYSMFLPKDNLKGWIQLIPQEDAMCCSSAESYLCLSHSAALVQAA